MTIHTAEIQATARERAFSMPIEQIDPSNPELFFDDTVNHYFARLRRDDPVHYAHSPLFGGYWSITRFQDIMSVDTNHAVFSSERTLGGIALITRAPESSFSSFISTDPPRHDEQRNVVSPIVAPKNLANLEGLIRERTRKVLDGLPRNETFNWVDRVSVELTTLMLATLFDFPMEDRHLLTWWSDVATCIPGVDSVVPSDEARLEELRKMAAYFRRLWDERKDGKAQPDLVSMLAQGASTRDMPPMEFIGNIGLLIVGGNDTTRNSMSGGLLALNQNPEQYDKLLANPALVETMVPEIIRWQTPLAHMARTARSDIEVGGKLIRKGDRVVMWYLSGNRDESAIENADRFIIDRARPRQHLSFGFGIHRCVGNRLAEMQLRILWEEILKRFPKIEVVGPPVRVKSHFVRGLVELPVRIPA